MVSEAVAPSSSVTVNVNVFVPAELGVYSNDMVFDNCVEPSFHSVPAIAESSLAEPVIITL